MMIQWDGDALDVSAIVLTQIEVDEFIAALEKAKALLPAPVDEEMERMRAMGREPRHVSLSK